MRGEVENVEERAWLTDADGLEDAERERRRLRALSEEQRQRLATDRNRDVGWALEDLRRALDRLKTLQVSLEVDDVTLEHLAGDMGMSAHWGTGKVKHVADLTYEVSDERWSVTSTLERSRATR